jgi:hypothetical protein
MSGFSLWAVATFSHLCQRRKLAGNCERIFGCKPFILEKIVGLKLTVRYEVFLVSIN